MIKILELIIIYIDACINFPLFLYSQKCALFLYYQNVFYFYFKIAINFNKENLLENNRF